MQDESSEKLPLEVVKKLVNGYGGAHAWQAAPGDHAPGARELQVVCGRAAHRPLPQGACPLSTPSVGPLTGGREARRRAPRSARAKTTLHCRAASAGLWGRAGATSFGMLWLGVGPCGIAVRVGAAHERPSVVIGNAPYARIQPATGWERYPRVDPREGNQGAHGGRH